MSDPLPPELFGVPGTPNEWLSPEEETAAIARVDAAREAHDTNGFTNNREAAFLIQLATKLLSARIATRSAVIHMAKQLRDYEQGQGILGEKAPEWFDTIQREIDHAKAKHGEEWTRNPFVALAILGEEYGELQQAVVQRRQEGGGELAVYKEAVQVAAMSVRFLGGLGDYDYDKNQCPSVSISGQKKATETEVKQWSAQPPPLGLCWICAPGRTPEPAKITLREPDESAMPDDGLTLELISGSRWKLTRYLEHHPLMFAAIEIPPAPTP